MDMIARETPYVTGMAPSLGGSGDPSPVTALGVLEAMRAAAKSRFGTADLGGRHVAIQGVGKVGGALAGLLHSEGARLTVADVDQGAVERCGELYEAEAVACEKIHAVEADVLAPCALGGAINDQTLPELRCQIVCGAANNQLRGDGIDERLAAAGILCVPDFIANSGGVINIFEELEGYDPERARTRVRKIRATTSSVIERAEKDNVTPVLAARRLAESRIESVSRLSRIRAGRLELRPRKFGITEETL
jgi:leucine dehydrogenase